MQPLLTVILPAYNADNYIRAAVQSILDQTFRDFEFIIINDGSTDNTLAILQQLANADARIKLITRPNTGYVVALNQGIALARGEFIARMDADDISLPQRFEKQLAYLQAHPQCVLLGTNVAQMDQDGAVIGPMSDIAFGHDQINHALLRRGWPIVHPSIIARTSAIKSIGGYIPAFCPNEDHDLFLKLAEIGQVENLPEVLVHYRKHAASISSKNPDKIAILVSKIILQACRRRGIPVPAEVAQPESNRAPSTAATQRAWAWSAIKHRNIATARKYALATLRRRPLSVDSWRLAVCAARGR
jgi:glycosyltransferase involved in cell wall biosynthesis